jgi:hypothetical protein
VQLRHLNFPLPPPLEPSCLNLAIRHLPTNSILYWFFKTSEKPTDSILEDVRKAVLLPLLCYDSNCSADTHRVHILFSATILNTVGTIDHNLCSIPTVEIISVPQYRQREEANSRWRSGQGQRGKGEAPKHPVAHAPRRRRRPQERRWQNRFNHGRLTLLACLSRQCICWYGDRFGRTSAKVNLGRCFFMC